VSGFHGFPQVPATFGSCRLLGVLVGFFLPRSTFSRKQLLVRYPSAGLAKSPLVSFPKKPLMFEPIPDYVVSERVEETRNHQPIHLVKRRRRVVSEDPSRAVSGANNRSEVRIIVGQDPQLPLWITRLMRTVLLRPPVRSMPEPTTAVAASPEPGCYCRAHSFAGSAYKTSPAPRGKRRYAEMAGRTTPVSWERCRTDYGPTQNLL
jgi:hypothetical protein